MMLRIDGSYGEGGGQILRTALSLSLVLNRPFEIYDIRKGRPKPGLAPQHLTCVNACSSISNGKVKGNELGSQELTFSPKKVAGGEFIFDVSERKGSAGAVSLVLQTLLLPLSLAPMPSRVKIIGGTHVPWSPPAHYLKHVFFPIMRKMGVQVDLELKKWGFYPKGGGEVEFKIRPVKALSPLLLLERGRLKRIWGISAVSNLPRSIAERQRNQGLKILQERDLYADIQIVDGPSIGQGTFFFLLAEYENVSVGFGGLGARGKPAEEVAREACSQFLSYLDSGACIDERLADQLIPYMALAKGESSFTTSKVTRHLLTNKWVVEQFLPVKIEVEGEEGNPGKVTVVT